MPHNSLHEVLVMETLRQSDHVAKLREYFVTDDEVQIVMVRATAGATLCGHSR